MADKIFDLLFGDRDPIREPGTQTGTPGDWWTVFNIVPDAFDHTTKGFQFYRSDNRKLDPKLRELGRPGPDMPLARSLSSPSIARPAVTLVSLKNRLRRYVTGVWLIASVRLSAPSLPIPMPSYSSTGGYQTAFLKC
jgi:hypothetical protein